MQHKKYSGFDRTLPWAEFRCQTCGVKFLDQLTKDGTVPLPFCNEHLPKTLEELLRALGMGPTDEMTCHAGVDSKLISCDGRVVVIHPQDEPAPIEVPIRCVRKMLKEAE